MASHTALDPEALAEDRARRRRSWRRFALGAPLGLGSCVGGVSGCVAWLLPNGKLAEGARAGGVGAALDEALRRGDAAPSPTT